MNQFDFKHEFDVEDVGLRVTAHTRGWHEAGRMNGPPERCYEAEGESETTIESITVCIDGKEFPLATTDPLFLELSTYLQDEAEKQTEAKLARDWHTLAKNARWERFTEEAEGRME